MSSVIGLDYLAMEAHLPAKKLSYIANMSNWQQSAHGTPPRDTCYIRSQTTPFSRAFIGTLIDFAVSNTLCFVVISPGLHFGMP